MPTRQEYQALWGDPGMSLADQEAAATLYYQAFTEGRESVTRGGYQAGHDLGYDVGYGVRNDHARSFVVGVNEGHAAGTQARYELMQQIKGADADASKTAAAAHDRMEARNEPGAQLPFDRLEPETETAAEPEPNEPEVEAEAG